MTAGMTIGIPRMRGDAVVVVRANKRSAILPDVAYLQLRGHCDSKV
jgi:hypothetical protein